MILGLGLLFWVLIVGLLILFGSFFILFIHQSTLIHLFATTIIFVLTTTTQTIAEKITEETISIKFKSMFINQDVH